MYKLPSRSTSHQVTVIEGSDSYLLRSEVYGISQVLSECQVLSRVLYILTQLVRVIVPIL